MTIPRRHRRWWLLLPPILLMFWLGARGLDANVFWNDEWYMQRDARSHDAMLDVVRHVAAQNPWHAPVYFVLLNWWGRLAAWNPFMLRALALFFGVLAVAWTYRLGRDYFSRWVGLAAALIVAFSEFYVHYLHENRMYTLAATLSPAALWLYLRLIRARRPLRARDYAAVLLLVVFMLHTHYFLGLLLAGVGLYHVLFVRKDRRWWLIAAMTVIGGALFLPWFSAFLRGFDQAANRSVGGYVSGVDVLAWVAYLFSSGYPLLLAVALFLAAGAWHRGGRQRQALGLTLFTLLIVAAIVVVTSLVLEVFGPSRARYLIFAWPLLALATAAGIAELGQLVTRHRRRAAGVSTLALAAWLGIGLWHNAVPNVTATLPGSTMNLPLHVILRELRPLHSPGDYIAGVIPDDNELRRYGNIVEFYQHGERMAADINVIGLAVPPQTQTQIYESVAGEIGHGRKYVWLAYTTDPMPAPVDEFRPYLDPDYALCGIAVSRPDWRLQIDLYARSPACCPPDTGERPALIDYGGGLKLTGIDLAADGGNLNAWVAWQGGSGLPASTYSVGLHVVDSDGDLVAQADYGLPADDFLCEQKAIDLGALPSGEYELRVIVYAWETGARLTGTAVGPGQQGDALPAAAFSVDGEGAITVQE